MWRHLYIRICFLLNLKLCLYIFYLKIFFQMWIILNFELTLEKKGKSIHQPGCSLRFYSFVSTRIQKNRVSRVGDNRKGGIHLSCRLEAKCNMVCKCFEASGCLEQQGVLVVAPSHMLPATWKHLENPRMYFPQIWTIFIFNHLQRLLKEIDTSDALTFMPLLAENLNDSTEHWKTQGTKK